VRPSAGIYNLFNFATFDLPGNALSGLLTGAAGRINGTSPTGHNVNRVGIPQPELQLSGAPSE
jgi:hypothetical protein